MDSVFSSQLEWATPRGLYFDKSLERKAIDGIYGIYATAPIKAGTLLASFPEENLLKGPNTGFERDPERFWLRWMKTAIKEFNNPNSEYSGIFLGFETLEDMKSYSSYFCTEEELDTLKAMNPVLHSWVENANAKADHFIAALLQDDPTLSSDTILTIYLNLRSRGFHPQGVVPALDQFNHSDLHGQTSTTEDGTICFYTKRDYSAGEQVFISYGPKDLYKHAINYNYFDPGGPHIIEFGRRTVQPAEGELGKTLLKHLKKFFKVQELNHNGLNVQFVDDASVILTDYGVSEGLVKFVQEACRCRLPMNTDERELMRQTKLYFGYLLDEQIKVNHVGEVDTQRVTPRLQRFYDLLVKEKEILLQNKKRFVGV